ncbi:MAG: DUF3352 domain-containing protein [Carboxylicivirga sp.]|nr:DUF3352 domain-containing protein [Carboxylicivirga sp.]
MKKSWVVLTIVISCALLLGVLFQINRVKSYNNEHTLRVIPSGAALILKADNFNSVYTSFFNTIEFEEAANHASLIRNVGNELKILDSIPMPEGNFVMSELKEFPFYCSFHAQGKDQVNRLCVFEVPNRRTEAKVEKALKYLSELGYKLSSRKYNSRTVYSIKKGKQFWYACLDNGVLLLSQSNLLIESSIRQQQSPDNWTDSESFHQISKTIGAGSKINLFINFNNLPPVLKPFTTKTNWKSTNLLKDQSNWAEMDVDISEDAILLNGFLSANSKGIIRQLLMNTQPQRVKIHDVLPGNTRAYMTYSLNSGKNALTRLGKYRKENNIESALQQQLHKSKSKYGSEVVAKLFEQLSGDMALAYLDYNHLQPLANGFLLLKLKSSSDGKDAILKLLKGKKADAIKEIKTYKPDDGVGFNIYEGFSDDLMLNCFDPMFPKVPQKYLAFYEDNLILADAPLLIEQVIYSNILNKTLRNDKTHQAFLSHFSSRENAFAFCETAHWAPILGSFFEPLLGDLSKEQKNALSSFYGLGVQLSGTGKMIYSTSYLQYLPSRESEPRTIWQSLLDSTVYSKPALVKNHYSKEREVIVQDNANNLYLLNNSGRILWKKPLDSPLMSEVVQIDYYRNNKLQYLFNTAQKIYLLDRNGNHVANFPVKMPSKASNGMAVFDYDNSRNYRFFVACENRRVYLYNDKGNIVSGWKFGKTDGIVTMPIQHFRSNNKDYIAFADDKRNYICDRRGKIRVKLDKQFERNVMSPYFLLNKNQANDYLVTTDIDGAIKKISLANGRVTHSDDLEINGNHALQLVTNGSQSCYLISEPNRIVCQSVDGKKIFDKDFDNEINLNIDRYQFSSQNIKFGISEKENGNIHLLNSDGKTYKGFPLKGNSRFSIGFLKSSASRFNLIVGGADNYIYNYQVD